MKNIIKYLFFIVIISSSDFGSGMDKMKYSYNADELDPVWHEEAYTQIEFDQPFLIWLQYSDKAGNWSDIFGVNVWQKENILYLQTSDGIFNWGPLTRFNCKQKYGIGGGITDSNN